MTSKDPTPRSHTPGESPFWSGLLWGGLASLTVAGAGWFAARELGWLDAEPERPVALAVEHESIAKDDPRGLLREAVERAAATPPPIQDAGSHSLAEPPAAVDPAQIRIDEKAYRAKYVGKEAELTKIGRARKYRVIDGQIAELERAVQRLEAEGKYERAREVERDIIKLKVKREQVADMKVDSLAP
jgi:hypothetical protein